MDILMEHINPLADYDRQKHLAWFDREHPGALEWPPEPRDDVEAARYITQYAPGPDIAPVVAWLLDRGLEVSFMKEPEGIVVMVDDHAAGVHTGIGDTLLGALEAAIAGMTEAGL
jgi:hypothetical protein